MPGDDGAQLAACVAACAEYSNRDSMHDECILLHQRDVNCGGPGDVRPERCSRVLPFDAAPCYRLVDDTDSEFSLRMISAWSSSFKIERIFILLHAVIILCSSGAGGILQAYGRAGRP